jgi:hypothetical protein
MNGANENRVCKLNFIFNKCHHGLKNDLLDMSMIHIKLLDVRVRPLVFWGCRMYQQLDREWKL